MKLWIKILIGLLLGGVTGLILGEHATYIKPIGTLFLNMINMIIVPLIFASTTVGITSIHDPKKLGRISRKTISVYIATTFFAIITGMTLAHFSQTGFGLGLQPETVSEVRPPALGEILISIVPNNLFSSMVKGNVLQVIVFALFLGVAINFSGEKGKPVLHFLESLADVMYRLTSIVMEFSPIGVFALMAWVTGTFGLTLVWPLLSFLAIYYLACLLQLVIVYGTLLRGMAGLKLAPFFKGMGDASMMAFSTGSSAATLPVAMHCVQENLGVSKNISGFVLPLGLTMNMNGTAIFQVMSAIFIANAYDIPLDAYAYLTLALTAALSALGTAGVPGGGFIMLSAVLTSVGLPLEGLALLAGIDRLRDMATTTLNILGDAAVTVFIAQKEGELDERRYYHPEIIELQSSEN